MISSEQHGIRPSGEFLIRSLIEELTRACEVVSELDDVSYRRVQNSSGSIGAQTRHNLDFASSLIKGFETRRIDYVDRARDKAIETSRHRAIELTRTLIVELAAIDPTALERSVLVRSEFDKTFWLPSTMGREVEFVHSHTVHHHALIAEKMAGFGLKVSSRLGVARSTLEYLEQDAA